MVIFRAALAHTFSLQSWIELGKSFKILAFLMKDHRTIPIFHFSMPNYGVGFSSGALPRHGQDPPVYDSEDERPPQ
jgi:hypothetical protein